MDLKRCYIDVETTGVKHWKNCVIQLAGIIEINNKIKEIFEFKLAPHPKAKIEPSALEVSGYTLEQIKKFPDRFISFNQFTDILNKYVDKYNKKDKFFFVGYNSSFDVNFIRGLFKQCNNDYYGAYFWSGSIDIMALSLYGLANERYKMSNFKLMTVARQLGIQIDESKLHDALYDIQITRDIFLIFERSIIK